MLIDRRTVLAGAPALLFAGQANAQAGPAEMTIGAGSAPVHLIEYASTTCSHCAHFHHVNWATLKTRYVDQGRVRLTMREMATPPAQVAFGMFQLARCGNADAPEYFRRLAILYERQRAIIQSGSMAGVRDALLALGAEWGLSSDQVIAALTDSAGAARLERSGSEAIASGIDRTPTFVLNGARIDDASFHTPEGMVAILDAAL